MRILVAVKQIPATESLLVEPTGRLRRSGVPLEMSAYCRRAVAKGVELAAQTSGSCVVVTLGPPVAGDVLLEALAWGADDAILLSDPAFAGSDTLATARALAALAELEGPFDLLLVGRSSLDSDTGQVGPQLAELLDLPFAAAVRELEVLEGWARVRCEQDDGWRVSLVQLPAVLAVAERLCRPAKVPGEVWGALPADRVRRRSSHDLGAAGPWGSAGSPTRVGAVRRIGFSRAGFTFSGPVELQVEQALSVLVERGALSSSAPGSMLEMAPASVPGMAVAEASDDAPVIAVLVEPGRVALARELLGCARRLAAETAGRVVALAGEPLDPVDAWSWGADEVLTLVGTEEDVAAAASSWAERAEPLVVLAPATYWGREVASRLSARIGAGLTGDALELEMDTRRLVAWKPVSGGGQLAAITASSPTQMATVRPGVLKVPRVRPGGKAAVVGSVPVRSRGRVQHELAWRDDDLDAPTRAQTVIGVGVAVPPDGYCVVEHLARLLGAEMVGTRKVTDAGWLPRSRQVGITGRSIAPRLYVAVGLQGKLNHLAGVRSSGTILGVNNDPAAPLFDACDVGILGDWRVVVPALSAALERKLAGDGAGAAPRRGPVGAGRGSFEGQPGA